MSQRRPVLFTAVVALCVGVAAVVGRLRDGHGTSGSAEAVVHALFDAAREGDVAAYLSCFDADLRHRLERHTADIGAERAAADLRRRARQVRGTAVLRDEERASDPQRTRLLVDVIYADRTDRQVYGLRRRRGRWLIEETTSGADVRMPIPYGTPVVSSIVPGTGQEDGR